MLDPLTNGLHTVLRSTTECLSKRTSNPSPLTHKPILAQLDLSLHTYPKLHAELSALKHPPAEPAIDMAALIKEPAELFLSENEWAGVRWKEERRKAEEVGQQNASEYLAFAIKTHQQAQAKSGTEGWENEGPEMLQFVMDHAADLIVELDASRALMRDDDGDDAMDQIEDGADEVKEPSDAVEKQEDARLRELRLNLLSLAKRAPLDKIARLPADLVPENIRRFVPTLA